MGSLCPSGPSDPLIDSVGATTINKFKIAFTSSNINIQIKPAKIHKYILDERQRGISNAHNK